MSVQLGPVTYTITAVAAAPVETPDTFVREDTGKGRVFEVKSAEITYVQQYTQSSGDLDTAIGPWQASAIVEGEVQAASTRAGTQTTGRLFTRENAPEWLGKIIDELHPDKHR
jgi:hypothetical protein